MLMKILKPTQEKSYFLGLSFNEKDEVFRKRQTYMYFGRIKKFFSWNHSQTYRCFSRYCICVGFRSAMCVCRRHYEEVKKYIKRSWPLRCYLKNGHRQGKAFLTLKVYRKWTEIVVFKRKKAFCIKKNLNLDEVSWTLDTKYKLATSIPFWGNFPVELRLVADNISSNTFFAF